MLAVREGIALRTTSGVGEKSRAAKEQRSEGHAFGARVASAAVRGLGMLLLCVLGRSDPHTSGSRFAAARVLALHVRPTEG